jgi:hypothetical protein
MSKTINGITYAKTVVDHIYIAVDTLAGQHFFADFNKIYSKSKIGGNILDMYREARAVHTNLYLNV